MSFVRHFATVGDMRGVGRVTIDMLPDVALLEIFDWYVNQAREEETFQEGEESGDRDWIKVQAWHSLVHVCQKWRTIVLESPHRLDLRLLCTDKTPVKETLAVWPPLPIVIGQYGRPTQMDNIIAALEYNDRVCQIAVVVTNSQLEVFLAAMQQPFPALTKLLIWRANDEIAPVVPEPFLGGSAPRLQHLLLRRIPFPGLPKLLLSAIGLVTLNIQIIPHSGYISPDAMVRCLSTLTSLKKLSLGFESPLSRPVRENRRPHPPTRSALPALTFFWFKGVSEYLEDLVARIDAPLLDRLYIMFFHQLIFDTPQLAQFVARTSNIQPEPPVEAHITFRREVAIASSWTVPRKFDFEFRISCRQSDWQLSSLTQICSSSFPEAFISTVEHLYICESKYVWQDDIEDSQCLEVLHPFTALKILHVSREFLPRIALAFQELAGERVTEVLPTLQSLFLEELPPSGPVREAVEKFVAARQLAGHPIAVSHWDGKLNDEQWTLRTITSGE
jgi:hypothetical protein